MKGDIGTVLVRLFFRWVRTPASSTGFGTQATDRSFSTTTTAIHSKGFVASPSNTTRPPHHTDPFSQQPELVGLSSLPNRWCQIGGSARKSMATRKEWHDVPICKLWMA
jgi:hypothetical protein